MIDHSIKAAHDRMIEKKWDKIYVLVDIHNTVFRPSYRNKETYMWFDGAKETLQYMTKCKQICLILWTSSHEDKIKEYLDVFEANDIHFDYVNENPEVANDDLSCFDKKLYFNIGIDDKFGFWAENGDWEIVNMRLRQFFKI
jgi:hypothetical protein